MRIQAKDVFEALQIADEGRRSGRWDLFRGQANSDWYVRSSSERLSEEERAAAFETFDRFIGWAQSVSGMVRYFEHPDSLVAIAQHYGVPTQLIDFSDDPRVAGFFACDTDTSFEKQEAAIVCLNSADFQEFWGEPNLPLPTKDGKKVRPELVRLDVANLWRLQQQKGSFLWNPIRNLEQIYDFDRIVFPRTENEGVLVPRIEIYPVHQSELEKLLTSFFMEEQLREGSAFIRTMPIHHMEVTHDSYDAKSWWPIGIARTPDWRQSDAWDRLRVEHSSDVMPGFQLEIDPSRTLEQISIGLIETLSSTFIEDNRKATLDIRSKFEADFDHNSSALVSCVRRVWNGMRILPYSAEEIRVAMARMLDLFPLSRKGMNPQKAFGPECFYVDMASGSEGSGAYSRGTITREAFIAALNPSFLLSARVYLESLEPSYREESDTTLASNILNLAGRPWERFSFSGLRNLLVEQLIPSQVAWRVASSEHGNLRTVIYFSPTELKVFGLA